jgi:hypothetical protein
VAQAGARLRRLGQRRRTLDDIFTDQPRHDADRVAR